MHNRISPMRAIIAVTLVTAMLPTSSLVAGGTASAVPESTSAVVPEAAPIGPVYLPTAILPDAGQSMSSPSAMARDASGRIYVADRFNDRVKVFDSNGVLQRVIDSVAGDPSTLGDPSGVAVDASGAVYVADTGNNRICKFSSTGTTLWVAGGFGSGGGEFSSPMGIAVDGGVVYVADTGNDRLQRFTDAGVFLGTWGVRGFQPGQYVSPRAIAASGGNVYVADSGNDRIQKLAASGAVLTTWGPYEISSGGIVVTVSRYEAPGGISVGDDGLVYIADTGNHQVERCTTTGGSPVRWGTQGTGNGQFFLPAGVATVSGATYVGDTGNDRVQKLSSTTGSWLATWDGAGSAQGEVSAPKDAAVDSAGRVYVADTANNRISIFNADGSWNSQIGSLSAPAGVAVDGSGAIYVANTGASQVRKYNVARSLVWTATGFSSPRGVSVGTDGRVYVADTGNRRVQVLDSSSGSVSRTIGSATTLVTPADAAYLDGDLFVVDSGDHKVKRFNVATGSLVTSWGGFGLTLGRFKIPAGIATDPVHGSVYVADTGNNRFQEFNIYGDVLAYVGTVAGGGSFGEFSAPSGIEVSASGSVFVTETGNHRVQVFDADRTPPTTHISGVPAGWATGAVEFALDATDDVDDAPVTYYRLGEAAYVRYTEPVSIVNEGTSVVTYYSIDSAGREESPSQVTVRIDGTPPVTTSNIGNGWDRPVFTVELSPADAHSGVSQDTAGSGTFFRINGGVEQVYSAPFDIDTVGATDVTYWSVDRAGNRENEQTKTVRLDSRAPVTTSNIVESWQDGPITVTLETDSVSPATTYYRVAEGAATTYTAPFTVNEEGETVVNYWSYNEADFMESERTGIVRIDTHAPVSSAEVATQYIGQATIAVGSVDALSGVASVHVLVDGVTQPSATVVVDSVGDHVIRYWAVDVAGNVESANVKSFTVVPEETTYTRVEGLSRYETGVQASIAAFPDGSIPVDKEGYRTAVLVTGEAFPDALAAAPLAGAVGGPMLLTRPHQLPDSVLAELHRLDLQRVFIIGGEAAVGSEVTNALANALPRIEVERIYGANRYETAQHIVERLEQLVDEPSDTVLVATGGTFPDAVAVSGVAYGESIPVLLARPGDSNSALFGDLAALSPSRVVVLGGEGAVSRATFSGISNAVSASVTRLGGATRYETALSVADWAVSQYGFTWASVGVATGQRFPDALVAGALLGGVRGPVVLTPTDWLHPSVEAALRSHRDEILDVYYLGGVGAVSDAVRSRISTVLR